ncbi:MAG: hypothetical protein ABMA64_41465 [Myxococcota bacterium]|jgi:hypothetical protein
MIWASLWVLGLGPALAQDDVAVDRTAAAQRTPSVASRLKNGLLYGIDRKSGVKIVRVQLYPEVVAMTDAALERALAAEDWLPVGILETKADGRLRVSCHLDTCWAIAGSTRVQLRLPPEPPPADERRRHKS